MQVPGENDLCWSASTLFGNSSHHIGCENRLHRVPVDGDAHARFILGVAKGRVADHRDVTLEVFLNPVVLWQIRMKFEFVELRLEPVQFHEVVNLLEAEIGYPDESGSLGPNQFLHALPSFNVIEARFVTIRVMWPVLQEEIEIIQAQLVQGFEEAEISTSVSVLKLGTSSISRVLYQRQVMVYKQTL